MSTKILHLMAAVLLAACTQTTQQKPPATDNNVEDKREKLSPFTQKISEGIDFVALGTEPFWGLDIDFEKGMEFKTPDGKSFNAPPVMAKKGSEGVLIYESKTEDGSLKVTLKKEPCSDGMSDNKFDYSVMVAVNGTTFQGCGQPVGGSLGSYWTLQSMNGAPVEENTFLKGRVPVLQVNVKESRYAGSDGCNNILGKARIEGNKIELEPGISTMMACPGKAHEEYAEAFYSVTDYTIENGLLTLLAEGKPVLVYGL
jgi:heat shock protein HslJ